MIDVVQVENKEQFEKVIKYVRQPETRYSLPEYFSKPFGIDIKGGYHCSLSYYQSQPTVFNIITYQEFDRKYLQPISQIKVGTVLCSRVNHPHEIPISQGGLVEVVDIDKHSLGVKILSPAHQDYVNVRWSADPDFDVWSIFLQPEERFPSPVSTVPPSFLTGLPEYAKGWCGSMEEGKIYDTSIEIAQMAWKDRLKHYPHDFKPATKEQFEAQQTENFPTNKLCDIITWPSPVHPPFDPWEGILRFKQTTNPFVKYNQGKVVINTQDDFKIKVNKPKRIII